MAHWAEIDANGTVLRVVVGGNDDPDEGYTWLVENLGGTWLKTSYNTRNGIHYGPDGEPDAPGFRGNYAGIGYTYDLALDAFLPPQPYPSWTLDASAYRWEPPIPFPEDGEWTWDEDSQAWVAA